jgi:chromate transporter
MSDRQIADIFAISQLSPEPNGLIVTLIAYHVARVADALAATVAMRDPTGAGWPCRLADADYGLGGGLAFSTRLNPLWILLAGGAFGFAGVV